MEKNKILKFFTKLHKIESIITKSQFLFMLIMFSFFMISIGMCFYAIVTKELNFIIGIILMFLSTFATIFALISIEKMSYFLKTIFILKFNKKEVMNVVPLLNFKEYKNNKENISVSIFKDWIKDIEGSESELIEIKNIIENFNILEDHGYPEYFSIIDILLKKYDKKINIENFLVRNKTLNKYEVIFTDLFNNNIKVINRLVDYLGIDQILNNQDILEKVNMDYIYGILKEEFKLNELVELMFEKDHTNFIDKEYDLNIWKFFNSSNYSQILELKRLILEDIIDSEDENLVINYKENFLELVEEIKCKNFDKLFILKQKLKKIKVENKEFNVITI